MVHGHTETFNTMEKASHIMLETHVNSHCNVTMKGYFYQLDVELMLHARTMITLHLWWCYLSADIDPCSHPKSIRFTAWQILSDYWLLRSILQMQTHDYVYLLVEPLDGFRLFQVTTTILKNMLQWFKILNINQILILWCLISWAVLF